MDSNFLGLMDLWVRIFWVGLNFLMVDGFKFCGFNGFVSVMVFPIVSCYDLAYLL